MTLVCMGFGLRHAAAGCAGVPIRDRIGSTMLWLKRMYAWIVFRIGDIHTTSRFPWVSWQVPEHLVTYGEVLDALPSLQHGDVGLHRDRGYLSNAFIPGFMKHAWIHVGASPRPPEVVEAVSEGVVLRSPVRPMYSDYTLVLRPRGVTEGERRGACLKARRVVGVGYDPFFEFDVEDELRYYTGQDVDGARADVVARADNAYSYTFSCTEIVSYAWWHKREELGIARKEYMGRQIITADDFISRRWDIVWMSRSITPEIARDLGLHEEGVSMIAEYLARRAAEPEPTS